MKSPSHPERRTVFVLGAGFSCRAGFPLQPQLLRRAVDLGVMDIPAGAPDSFLEDQATALEFLRRVFARGGDRDLREVFESGQGPTLEDVFTLLDQTIARRSFCGGYSWSRLSEVREALNRVVLFPIHAAHEAVSSNAAEPYRQFAALLLEQRMAGGLASEVVSVVSLNWDCLLEDSIYWCIRRLGGPQCVDVDYCCYTTPLTPLCPHTPSLTQRASGLVNLKVMKLHGSANWLLCPNCNRLFTGLGAEEDEWRLYVTPRPCPVCSTLWLNREDPRGDQHPRLEPFFVTPTYVKVFDNPHIRMTWHNAYTTLAAADEVVFIGYSLPEADYHVRTLLRRAVSPDAEITVVLIEDDRPKRNTPKYLRRHFPSSRYQAFFGSRRPAFTFGGAKAYFEAVFAGSRLSRQLARVRRLAARNRRAAAKAGP